MTFIQGNIEYLVNTETKNKMLTIHDEKNPSNTIIYINTNDIKNETKIQSIKEKYPEYKQTIDNFISEVNKNNSKKQRIDEEKFLYDAETNTFIDSIDEDFAKKVLKNAGYGLWKRRKIYNRMVIDYNNRIRKTTTGLSNNSKKQRIDEEKFLYDAETNTFIDSIDEDFAKKVLKNAGYGLWKRRKIYNRMVIDYNNRIRKTTTGLS